jgi:hypothetical protein
MYETIAAYYGGSPKPRTRVPHISRAFREMSEIDGSYPASVWGRSRVLGRGPCISHISPTTGEIWGTRVRGSEVL